MCSNLLKQQWKTNIPVFVAYSPERRQEGHLTWYTWFGPGFTLKESLKSKFDFVAKWQSTCIFIVLWGHLPGLNKPSFKCEQLYNAIVLNFLKHFFTFWFIADLKDLIRACVLASWCPGGTGVSCLPWSEWGNSKQEDIGRRRAGWKQAGVFH